MQSARSPMTPARLPIPIPVCSLLFALACGTDGGDPAAAEGETAAAPATSTSEGTTIDPGGTPGAEASVTYYGHIKPMFDARCVACHQDGAIGPFALDNYEDAAAWSGSALSLIHISEPTRPY